MFEIFILFMVLFFLASEGFFSGSEIAIVTVDKFRLQYFVRQGNNRAKLLLDLWKKPENLIATSLIGTNLSVICSSVLTTMFFKKHPILLFEQFPELATSLFLGPVVLFFGEILPKGFFLKYNETMSFSVVYIFRLIQKFLEPFIVILSWISIKILRIFGLSQKESSHLVTLEDLKYLANLKKKELAEDLSSFSILKPFLHLPEITAKKIMTPLINLVAAPQDISWLELKKIMKDSGFSSIPIYQARIDNIVAVVFSKDLGKADLDTDKIQNFYHQPIFIPENKPVDLLFEEMVQKNWEMVIVIDEFGGCAGIITLENILEELVGEIEDEFDLEETPLFKWVEDDLIVDGQIPLPEFNINSGLNLPFGNYRTLAGFVESRLERIPQTGENILLDGIPIQILASDGKRINSIKLFNLRKIHV